jgi:adenine-specific DNA-methyltransferase
MNAIHGGQRQCILVTNNEVSEEDRQRLLRHGRSDGDTEWDAEGICKAVTWPRCKYIVNGRRKDGTKLSGEHATGNFEAHETMRPVTQMGFVEGTSLSLSERKDRPRAQRVLEPVKTIRP